MGPKVKFKNLKWNYFLGEKALISWCMAETAVEAWR
jgi:hypothetical protein